MLNPLADLTLHPLADLTLHPLADLTLHPLADLTLHPLADLTLHPLAHLTLHPLADLTLHPLADLTLHPLADMFIPMPTSLGSIRPFIIAVQRLSIHIISTPVYSHVLIYTAEGTETTWSEKNCPIFEDDFNEKNECNDTLHQYAN